MTDPAGPAPRGTPRALVLAAGYGSRLRPLTDHLPKPLAPILGRPLIDHVLDRLAAAGVERAAVNTHHLAGLVRGHLARRDRDPEVTIFHEPNILGTGGPLAAAGAFLSEADTFFLYNGDVLCDLDLRRLAAEHDRHRPLATLVLADWPEVNSVTVDGDGVVAAIGGSAPAGGAGLRRLTYTGIALFDRRFLDLVPAGPSSLVPWLRRAMEAEPGSVRGFAPRDLRWDDLGTLRRYLDAVGELVRKADRAPAPVHLAPGAALEEGAGHWGFVALGAGARAEAGCALTDCVVTGGALVEDGEVHQRAVIGPDWVATQEENERIRILAAASEAREGTGIAEAIAGHGSDRRFTRVREGRLSAVVMEAPADDPEFDRYVAVGRFLWDEGLGGPEILEVNEGEHRVIMEDLGSTSLYELAARGPAAQDRGYRRRLYRLAVDRLVDLQTRGTALAGEGACPEAADRRFDHEMLRWETDYFRQRFLGEEMGLAAADLSGLDDEFEALARAVLEHPLVLMHRDFQSQNIFIKNDAVRLVDFQGMRLGPPHYDLMSLVRDAYVDLGGDLRRELMERHRRGLAAAGGPAFPPGEAQAMAVATGLQRNMQALGAFAFLSREKGKTGFRAFIPLGLRHLAEGLDDAENLAGLPPLPRLTALVRGLAARVL